jgi:hypothetical protein
MTVAQAVAEQMQANGLPPEQLKLLKPFCEAAYARLKPVSLNKWDLPYGIAPFEQLDFGYYYTVELQRTVQPTGQEAKSTKQSTICPAPGDLASCEALWRPIVAPMIAARDAERKKEAEVEAKREALIAPLEAAFAAKLKILSTPATPRRAR